MTTPKAILVGFSLVALAIASLPYSNGVIPEAQAMGCATQIQADIIIRNQRLIEDRLMDVGGDVWISKLKIEANGWKVYGSEDDFGQALAKVMK